MVRAAVRFAVCFEIRSWRCRSLGSSAQAFAIAQISPVPPAQHSRVPRAALSADLAGQPRAASRRTMSRAALSLHQRSGAAEGRALAVGTPPRCALSLAARNQPPGLNQPRLWNPPWMSSVDVLSEYPQSLDRRQPASSSRISPVDLAAPAPSHQTASATSSGWITSSRAARSNHSARCWA